MLLRRSSMVVLGLAGYGYSSLMHTKGSYCDNKAKPFDCQQAACQSKQELFQQMMALSESEKISSKANANPERSSTDVPKEHSTHVGTTGIISGCPLDKEELGRSAWNVIHTVSAYYPDEPTAANQEAAVQFIKSFAALYPCHVCQPHFEDFVAKNPPRVNSRIEFMLWCCELHNSVNKDLGMKVYPCDISSLQERWRTGKPSCWGSLDSH